ncbi:hypothetical protein SAMN04487930_103137 [Cytophaga hutchinsonii ATCC 33406]|nr:hypothetical protein SAMN04487930_103137 [Cytophaga hutchinsonii ATCC 33406]
MHLSFAIDTITDRPSILVILEVDFRLNPDICKNWFYMQWKILPGDVEADKTNSFADIVCEAISNL